MTKRVIVAMTGLLGLPAGLVWLLWAEPAQWLMTERGLVMTESLAVGQFDVVAKFTIIGVVIGFIIGATVSTLARSDGWRLVPMAMASSLLAAALCWLVVRLFGPQDPHGLSDVPLGELVPTQFTVDAWPAFLAWPLAAVFVVTVSIYMSDDLPEASSPEFSPQSLES